MELLVAIIGLGLIDQWFALEMTEWTLNPFVFAVLLFSLRYGLNIGLMSFLLTLGYYLIEASRSGGDLFLLFYDSNRFIEILFLLLLSVIGGLYGTSFKERYESLSDRNDELNDDNEEMKEVIELMEGSQKSMQERVLESEYTLKRIYQVGKALDQPTPDLIRNEAIQIISDLFKADEVAIYRVDSSRSAMRLSVRKGSKEVFPQTIFVDHESSMYRRLFANKTVTIRTVDDEDGSPVLVGPVVSNYEVREVLIINNLDFAKLTSYEIQILSLLLDWVSDRIDKSQAAVWKEEETQMFPGTRIYIKEAFDEKVAMQQQRKETYGVDYSIVELPFEGFHDMSKVEAEIILRAYLRELDIIGFDESSQTFSFLLPGTEEEKATIVEKRIQKFLYEKGVNYAD